MLFAGCLRIAIETSAWLASRVAPGRAEAVRNCAEHTASALYYAGIPLLLAARFLA